MYFHRDFFGEITFGHGGRHVGDVSHLIGEVVGHQVHIVGEVFPDAGHPFDSSLPAKFTLSSHLPGYPGHLVGESVQLSDHPVADLGCPEELTL